MKSSWRTPFVLLLTCLIACFALLAYPVYVIRPFRHQGATELSVALQVMRFRPAIVVSLALLATLSSLLIWRRSKRLLPRITVIVLAVVTIVSCVLSFVNVYELMFHPLRRPTFKTPSETRLDGGEQVIAVKLNRSARAYPIRVISYHHIVNDVLAGFPIVATY